jgi:hypothetical protein
LNVNYSTAIFLINKHARAIAATYEAEDNAKRSIFKTLDQEISIGDFVVVPTDTRHKMTVVKVVEVDVDVDFDAPTPVQWIIGVVNRGYHEDLLKQESEAIKVIKSAELRKKRDELREAMFKDHLETIKALPLAAMNGDHKEPQP